MKLCCMAAKWPAGAAAGKTHARAARLSRRDVCRGERLFGLVAAPAMTRNATHHPHHLGNRHHPQPLDLDGTGRAEIATGIGFFDHMLTALRPPRAVRPDRARDGRPAYRLPPHHRGCRHRARPRVGTGARRQARHPPLRPRRGADGRGAGRSGDRHFRPPVPRLVGRLRAAQGRRDGHRVVRGVLSRLRHQRADHPARDPEGRHQRPPRRRGLLQGARRAPCAWPSSSIRASATPSLPPRGRCEDLDRPYPAGHGARCWCAKASAGARCCSARSGCSRIAPGSPACSACAPGSGSAWCQARSGPILLAGAGLAARAVRPRPAALVARPARLHCSPTSSPRGDADAAFARLLARRPDLVGGRGDSEGRRGRLRQRQSRLRLARAWPSPPSALRHRAPRSSSPPTRTSSPAPTGSCCPARAPSPIAPPGLPPFPGCGDAIVSATDAGAPFLGICVGMQLMAVRGLEHAITPGFGWIARRHRRHGPAI